MMARAYWKGPYLNKKLKGARTGTNKIIAARHDEVTPASIDKVLEVYDGREYSEITPNRPMIGHKLGEFVFTRQKTEYKSKKKKKKKKKQGGTKN